MAKKKAAKAALKTVAPIRKLTVATVMAGKMPEIKNGNHPLFNLYGVAVKSFIKPTVNGTAIGLTGDFVAQRIQDGIELAAKRCFPPAEVAAEIAGLLKDGPVRFACKVMASPIIGGVTYSHTIIVNPSKADLLADLRSAVNMA